MFDVVKYQKHNAETEFKHIIEIIQLYYKLDGITDFVLDLQIYNDDRGTEPRIWLSAPKNHLGIRLMLYGVPLNTVDENVPNEKAIEVFSEYMKFYAQNQELFRLWHDENDNYKPIASITFEISNR